MSRYYGVHPDLLEGIEWFTNSENQDVFSKVVGTANDLSSLTHIETNSPYVNVLIADTYKARAVIDSGSTTTIMSKGMYDAMP